MHARSDGWGSCGAGANQSNPKGRSRIRSKVARRSTSTPQLSLTHSLTHSHPISAAAAQRDASAKSGALNDTLHGALTGRVPTRTRRLPTLTVAHFAVTCISRRFRIKPAFIHEKRRSETGTNTGGQARRAASSAARRAARKVSAASAWMRDVCVVFCRRVEAVS